MTKSCEFILPNWPAPQHIRAFTTTRQGGVSVNPYDSLNLGDHVADNDDHVKTNRHILEQAAKLPSSPYWLTQVHGTDVITPHKWSPSIEADGTFTNEKDKVCLILTADCLPVLITDTNGKEVAAVHAGWRGLLNGIIENAINQFSSNRQDILVWLGPAIGPSRFEVGVDVYTAFTQNDRGTTKAFIQTDDAHYLADIYELARQRLSALKVTNIYGGEYCTFNDSERFYSYRREKQTGRMASVIWIDDK